MTFAQGFRGTLQNLQGPTYKVLGRLENFWKFLQGPIYKVLKCEKCDPCDFTKEIILQGLIFTRFFGVFKIF